MLGNEVWQNTMGGRTVPQRTQLDTLKRHTCAPTTAAQSKLEAETPCPLTGPMARAMSPSSCSTLAARLRLLSVMRPCRAARGSRLDGRLYHVHCRPVPRNAHMQMPCSASLGVARPVRHTTKPAQEHPPTAANQQNEGLALRAENSSPTLGWMRPAASASSWITCTAAQGVTAPGRSACC